MSDHVSLAPERCGDPFARVVGPVLHGDGPLQDRADALADPSSRFRLLVPDQGQSPDDVGACDLRDGALPEPLQAHRPVLGVLRIAPAGAL